MFWLRFFLRSFSAASTALTSSICFGRIAASAFIWTSSVGTTPRAGAFFSSLPMSVVCAWRTRPCGAKKLMRSAGWSGRSTDIIVLADTRVLPASKVRWTASFIILRAKTSLDARKTAAGPLGSGSTDSLVRSLNSVMVEP